MGEHEKRFLVYSKTAPDIRAIEGNLKFFFSEVSMLWTCFHKDIKDFLLKKDFKPEVVLGTSSLFCYLFFPKKYFTWELKGFKFVIYPSKRSEYEWIENLIEQGSHKNVFLMDSSVAIEELMPLKNALEKLGVFVSKCPSQNIPKNF